MVGGGGNDSQLTVGRIGTMTTPLSWLRFSVSANYRRPKMPLSAQTPLSVRNMNEGVLELVVHFAEGDTDKYGRKKLSPTPPASSQCDASSQCQPLSAHPVSASHCLRKEIPQPHHMYWTFSTYRDTLTFTGDIDDTFLHLLKE